jgi:hypothetical protein
VFAVVFFHRIYESVGLGNASFDYQPPSKLVAPVREPSRKNRAQGDSPLYAGEPLFEVLRKSYRAAPTGVVRTALKPILLMSEAGAADPGHGSPACS